jgi:hypothetical protein
VAALLKSNDEFILSCPDVTFGRDKETVQLLGVSLLVTAQVLTEPSETERTGVAAPAVSPGTRGQGGPKVLLPCRFEQEPRAEEPHVQGIAPPTVSRRP